MRNILEYPITTEEKYAWLEKKQYEWSAIPEDEVGIGDLTGLIIDGIINDLYRLESLDK